MRSVWSSSQLSWLAHLHRSHWKCNANVLCCKSAVSVSADRNSPCLKNWESTDWFQRCVCVLGPPQGSRKKYSELSQNFICIPLTRLSLRNAKSTASNYLTIANNELEIMWNTLLVRMVPMLADSKTAPLNTNQKLYRVSHEPVSNIDRIHNHITGFVFQYSQPLSLN